jgi:hypothetical protein
MWWILFLAGALATTSCVSDGVGGGTLETSTLVVSVAVGGNYTIDAQGATPVQGAQLPVLAVCVMESGRCVMQNASFAFESISSHCVTGSTQLVVLRHAMVLNAHCLVRHVLTVFDQHRVLRHEATAWCDPEAPRPGAVVSITSYELLNLRLPMTAGGGRLWAAHVEQWGSSPDNDPGNHTRAERTQTHTEQQQ